MRQMRWRSVVGDADALGPGVFGVGLGAAALYNRKRICSHKNWKMRKEAVKLCLVKRKIQISYKLEYDNNYNNKFIL